MAYAHRRELIGMLVERSMGRELAGETFSDVLTEDTNRVRQIRQIEKLGARLMRSKGDLFTVRGASRRRPAHLACASGLAEQLLAYVRGDLIGDLQLQFGLHRMSPRFDVVADAITSRNLDRRAELASGLSGGDLECLVEDLNSAVGEIRSKLQSHAFQRWVTNFEGTARKNHKALVRYINGLWRRHPTMYVLRLDIGWQDQPQQLCSLFDPGFVLLPEVRDGFAKFRREAPRQLTKAVGAGVWLGYAWKIDLIGLRAGFGPQPLPHMHLIAFLDPSCGDAHEAVMQCLASVWRGITRGRGMYRDWSVPGASYYGAPGTGLIAHADKGRLKGLGQALKFLTMADYLVRYKVLFPPKSRTFGKGELPAKKRRAR